MFTKLLVPLDRSPLAEQALGRAAAIARASSATIEVALVHQPVPFAGFGDAPWNAEEWKHEEKYLETIATELSTGAAVHATHSVLRGEAVETICLHALDTESDLIVMTSHGRTGLSRMWLGSVAHGVLRRSSVPVLMLRPVEGKSRQNAAHHLFKHILVPVDGSAFSAEIIPHASSLARCSGAKITLLRVVRPIPSVILDVGMPFAYPPTIPDQAITDSLVEEAKAEISESARQISGEGCADVDAQVVVAEGVAQAILDFARGHSVDAIAMSTHGRGASRLFMGSIADKIVRGSELPTLLHCPIGVSEEPHTVGSPNVGESKSAFAGA
jgi:nucleotide-binding universal stress UspA family protein